MSHEAILKDLASKLPVRPNARKRQIWMACFAVGIVSFAFLYVTQPQRAWGAWAVNTILFLGMAMGGVVLSAAIRLCNGKWAGPIQRIGESLSAYMPWGIGTMVVLLVAGIWTYLPWVSEGPPERLKGYLNVPFLYVRTLGGLALFWWLARKLVRNSLRPDLHALMDHVDPSLRAEYDKIIGTWRGDDAEKAHKRHQQAYLSPQVVLVFVFFFSLIAYDFIMLLTTEWASGLFGWFVYASAFNCGVAMTAFLAAQLRGKYRLEAYITPNHLWDTGKVMFSFCIFWAYQFWSQYLPIWYANMPEETWFLFLRLEDPWRPLSFAVFGMIFVIPFFGLMNKATKSSPFWMTWFTLLVIAGVWLERHVLVMPSLNPDTVWVGLPEVGVTIGFIGLFGWAVQGFVTKFPVVKVIDVLAASGGHGH